MKELMRLNKKQLQRHALIWAIIICFINLIDPLSGSLVVKVVGSGLIHFNFMIVFYSLGFFVFPRFWKSNWTLLIIGISCCLIIYWLNAFLIYKKIILGLGGKEYFEGYSLFEFLIHTLINFNIVGAAGTASFFNRYGLYKMRLQTEKEKSLLVKELNFLKTQFNSHITFNFLNFCYSKVHRTEPQVAESIDLFSEMLRYTLQTKPEEKVALNAEITYIQNFIDLQKLLSSEVYVDFKYEGSLDNTTILPRILITFVENAFKHGVFNDPENPIVVMLKSDNDKINFTVTNKINRHKKVQSSYTGLQNVKQILDIYYPDKHILEFDEQDEIYKVSLELHHL